MLKLIFIFLILYSQILFSSEIVLSKHEKLIKDKDSEITQVRIDTALAAISLTGSTVNNVRSFNSIHSGLLNFQDQLEKMSNNQETTTNTQKHIKNEAKRTKLRNYSKWFNRAFLVSLGLLIKDGYDVHKLEEEISELETCNPELFAKSKPIESELTELIEPVLFQLEDTHE